MRTICSSCRRRGISSILGTIIFVGIMFTAVIPMFLVMRQADTLHELRKHDLELMDDETSREYLRVSVFSAEDSPEGQPRMVIEVENRGDSVTKLVRIWINDEKEERNYLLNTNDIYAEYFDVATDPKNYSITVSTDKGNLFASVNALSYDGFTWIQETTLWIYVTISSPGVIFHIEVDGISPIVYHEEAMVQKIGGSVFQPFKVDVPGTYNVKIKRGSQIIHNEEVTITFPDGPSVVWVDA